MWMHGATYVDDGILLCSAISKIEPIYIELQTSLLDPYSDRVAVVVDVNTGEPIASQPIPRNATGRCIVSVLISQSNAIVGWLRSGGVMAESVAVA